jgi:hypothetical protein
MGFNKRKMEDARRQEAKKETAARRATERQISMATGPKKSRGRPKTGTGEQIGMRWQRALLQAIDSWRDAQWDKPSRAEAIRRLVQLGLRSRGLAAKPMTDLEIGRRIAFLLEQLDHGLLTGQELSDAKKLKRLLSR